MAKSRKSIPKNTRFVINRRGGSAANQNETINRIKFFQNVHTLPLSYDFNYEGWIANFGKSEKAIAYHLLDFFTFYSARMINQMLRVSISNAGAALALKITGWKHENLMNKCFYSFIPGENPHPTDSGHIFVRKLRDELGIPEERIIDFNSILQIPTSSTAITPIIFVDDFVGSGAQCDNAWNKLKLENKITLKQLQLAGKYVFVYAPLVVNEMGYKRIISKCSSLSLTPTHILGREYNLFNEECFCWKNNIKLFNKGVKLILSKSKLVGIPSTSGIDTKDEKGFGEQGLAIAFEHGAPDAIPALFYWAENGWTPLIRKTYN